MDSRTPLQTLYLHLGNRPLIGEVEDTVRLLRGQEPRRKLKLDQKSPLRLLMPASQVSCMHELPNAVGLCKTGFDMGGLLVYASIYGREDLVKAAIDAGVDVNIIWKNLGNTSLHAASRCASATCVRLLLQAGAHVSALNCYGWTALHEACWAGSSDCIEALLSAGANWTINDAGGYTAMDTVRAFGQMDAWNTAFEAFKKKKRIEQQQDRERRKRRRGWVMIKPGDLEALFNPENHSGPAITEEGEDSVLISGQDIHEASLSGEDTQRANPNKTTLDGDEAQIAGPHPPLTGQSARKDGTGPHQRATESQQQHPSGPTPARSGRGNLTSFKYLVIALSALVVLLSLSFTTKTAQSVLLKMII